MDPATMDPSPASGAHRARCHFGLTETPRCRPQTAKLNGHAVYGLVRQVSIDTLACWYHCTLKGEFYIEYNIV